MSTHLPGLELGALERFFAAHVCGVRGPLVASLITGGKSNLTYRIQDSGQSWVLRRPPLGVLTPSAHDMAREYRVISALHGSGVPVAAPVVLCEDSAVIGAPFAVVSFVEGRVLRDGREAAALSEADAQRCAHALIDALAELHRVPFAQVGLAEFGRPSGYLGRQLQRWRGQWDRVATRQLGSVDALHGALSAALPKESGAAIVHGDYRLDNTILNSADPGRIAAIVDWEMATLGDPLADLGLFLVYWDPISEPVLGLRHAPSANPGFPGALELAERYAARTGHSLRALSFYRALGYFKLAVIAEGIHQRYLAGKTVGDGFQEVGRAVTSLLDAGRAVLGQEAD